MLVPPRLLCKGALVAVFILTTNAYAQSGDGTRLGANSGDNAFGGQHTSGVIARVGIQRLPIGCHSAGKPTDPVPWTSASGSAWCSLASQEPNIDGLMILVNWKTLQPQAYDEPLRSYYIDNAIYSLAHPERQSIHLAILAGVNSPAWFISSSTSPGASFPNSFGSGRCEPSAGGPTQGGTPGKIWNVFSFNGRPLPMPNPFGSNSCLFTALDNVVQKLGQTGDYRRPSTSPYPQPLAPYDDLYYNSAPGKLGFVHTTRPTPTMNKIIGHISVLGPHSYDAESVLCETAADCENVSDNPKNGPNFQLWKSLEADDLSMEAAIEDAQKKAIDIYATRFPSTFWTVDLVERQMPFFSPDGKGCGVKNNPYPPTGPGPRANDASDCLGKLRTNLIAYIEASYPLHGGVQNNSLGANPESRATHPVWRQTALAGQGPPLNPVKLFVGLQVDAPRTFYPIGNSRTFEALRNADQTAVNLAKQMLPRYSKVDFIEFYDVDIANNFSVPLVNGSRSMRSRNVDKSASAINDDPNGESSGGFMYVPLMDAHLSLRGTSQKPPK